MGVECDVDVDCPLVVWLGVDGVAGEEPAFAVALLGHVLLLSSMARLALPNLPVFLSR